MRQVLKYEVFYVLVKSPQGTQKEAKMSFFRPKACIIMEFNFSGISIKYRNSLMSS